VFHQLIFSLLNFVTLAVFLMLVMLVLENIRPIQKLEPIRKEFWHDIDYAILMILISVPFGIYLNEYGLHPFIPYQIFGNFIQNWPMWSQILFGLVILDFAVYIRHRFMHEKLWSVHAIHHSPTEINWLTKYRLHPIEALIALTVTSLLLHIIGITGEAIAYAQGIIMVMDILNHTNIQFQFPKPLCYIIASPDYHKWHHAAENRAKNKNFVVVFPWIDLAFGTYFMPMEAKPKAFGFIKENDGNGREMPNSFIQQLLFPFQSNKANTSAH
jgi:sterol desaturase/sphingolipid hydroxylase (fatty acid hydroxylase superfamily)